MKKGLVGLAITLVIVVAWFLLKGSTSSNNDANNSQGDNASEGSGRQVSGRADSTSNGTSDPNRLPPTIDTSGTTNPLAPLETMRLERSALERSFEFPKGRVDLRFGGPKAAWQSEMFLEVELNDKENRPIKGFPTIQFVVQQPDALHRTECYEDIYRGPGIYRCRLSNPGVITRKSIVTVELPGDDKQHVENIRMFDEAADADPNAPTAP